MKLNKIHFIEKFAIVTFPIALAVGCTSTADQENKVMKDTDHFVKLGERSDIPEEKIPPSLDIFTAMDSEQNEIELTQASATDIEIDANSPSSEENSQSSGDSDFLETKLSLTKPEITKKKAEMPDKGIFHFAINNYDVAKTDHKALQQHARYLKKHPDMILFVDGFSDNRGPAHLNYQLSNKRAQQVAKILIAYGASESQLKVRGYGESFPLTDESSWDENRRVELEYGNSGSPDALFVTLD